MRCGYKITVFVLLIMTIVSFAGYLNAAGLTVPANSKVDFNTDTIVVVGDVTNAGTLQTNTGSIKLDGNWTNTGTFNAGSIGTVEFTGSTASTIIGSNVFVNFTCTQPGKQLSFEAGKTQTIAGTWTLTGVPGSLVTLRSTVPDNQWSVNPTTWNISFVDVKDSNNLSGTVINPSNSTDSGNNTNWFNTARPSPIITSFSPTTVCPGDTVIITGTNLSGATSVTFGGTEALFVAVDSDTQISAVVRSGSISGSVCVTTPGGSACQTGFSIGTFCDAPIITSFSPTSAAEGETVFIEGNNLSGVISVTFGSVEATDITSNTNTSISATVGEGNSGDVCVKTSAGTNCKSGFIFIIPDGPELPIISNFSPTSAGEGQTVIIEGSNLSDTISVTFGGVKAAAITFNTDTSVLATVGEGNSGGVCVKTSAGTNCKSGFLFIPVEPPIIDSFSPISGRKGDIVEITGENLSGVIIPGGVTIGGAKAAEITVISKERIAAVIGNCNPLGDENVYVTTSKGSFCKSGFTCIPDTRPIADFIADQTKGNAPLTVRFTDTSQNNPTSWKWDFGDGSKSEASNPTHEYLVAGDYTVTLNVANSGGDDEIKNDFIHVVDPSTDLGKLFTFVCKKEFARGPIFGLEKLLMNVRDSENCTLKLINHEPGKTVEVSSLLRKGLKSAVNVEPARGVTDENGEIDIKITAIRKGKDWAAWAVKNDRGQFKFRTLDPVEYCLIPNYRLDADLCLEI